mmetsp:Transcript_15100/g.27882  ORF Transcript_15100/g.27882 Transcript_15100/m.27882 type:complete len:350 (-) Transcript_15100:342-1391(-)
MNWCVIRPGIPTARVLPALSLSELVFFSARTMVRPSFIACGDNTRLSSRRSGRPTVAEHAMHCSDGFPAEAHSRSCNAGRGCREWRSCSATVAYLLGTAMRRSTSSITRHSIFIDCEAPQNTPATCLAVPTTMGAVTVESSALVWVLCRLSRPPRIDSVFRSRPICGDGSALELISCAICRAPDVAVSPPERRKSTSLKSCSESSCVGATTTIDAGGALNRSPLFFTRLCNAGIRNAKVFPAPVSACKMTFFPDNISAADASWIRVGARIPRRSRDEAMLPSSSKAPKTPPFSLSSRAPISASSEIFGELGRTDSRVELNLEASLISVFTVGVEANSSPCSPSSMSNNA